jgi:ribose transport system substrate-binding protein
MKSLANEFFKTMAEGARKHQGEHSSEYELIVNGIKDERDLKRQVDLVEEMVAQRVDEVGPKYWTAYRRPAIPLRLPGTSIQ